MTKREEWKTKLERAAFEAEYGTKGGKTREALWVPVPEEIREMRRLGMSKAAIRLKLEELLRTDRNARMASRRNLSRR